MIDKVMSVLLRTTDTMKVTPSKTADKIQQKPFTLEQNLAAETAKEMSKTSRSSEAKSPEPTVNDRQDQLTYVPLPLHSPVYEDTRFYWKLKDMAAKTNEQGEAKVIFSVNTNTLGLLWFTLTAQPGKLLSVQCISEASSVAEVFRASSGELQEELAEVGYEKVIFSCRVQSGIRSIGDIDADFASSESYSLLDVQV